MNLSPWKYLSWLAGCVFVLAAVAPFVRPTLLDPPVTNEIQVPAQVKQVLRDRCYQCHSNETRLPWFDKGPPVYWVVARDVRLGRSHLNFSTIGSEPLATQRAFLYEAITQVQLGAMPLPSYLAVHRNARVTPAELAILKDYLSPFAPTTQATVLPAAQAVPVMPVTTAENIRPSLNNVPYFPEYKNWRTISTTDRGDNNTLRIITANDIAIQAIESHHTNPWLDGAVMAKIALKTVDDGHGHIYAGDFIQVEFMEKDHVKYASTAGWGFARWRGLDLKPYGKDSHLGDECVSCHRPVAGNDYVYTLPIPRPISLDGENHQEVAQ